jgi:hypothetical protein
MSIRHLSLHNSHRQQHDRDWSALHCVLQACAGATPEERSRWRLGPPQDYAFLSSQVYQLKGANDAEDYK